MSTALAMYEAIIPAVDTGALNKSQNARPTLASSRAATAERSPRAETENDDDDDEAEHEPSGRRWKSARYVTRLIANHVQPMLNVAVTEAVRRLQYDDRSCLPCFVTTRLADPFIALRNCVDETLLF